MTTTAVTKTVSVIFSVMGKNPYFSLYITIFYIFLILMTVMTGNKNIKRIYKNKK